MAADDDVWLPLHDPQLRDMLDTLREGVQVLSPEWRYLYVNDAVARHGRRRREHLLGRTMLECYPGIEQTPMFAVLTACMRERREETFENEFAYDDGQRAIFELRIRPIREGLVVLSLDVTERRRLEHALRQSETLRALGQLAAGVAHDLNNILNPIALQAGLLRRHLADPDAAAVLGEIEAAIRTGAETVDRLRRFSKQEPDAPATSIALDPVADRALAICLPRFRERPAIDVRREGGGAGAVLVAAPELATTIVNLIVNALDALGHRGRLVLRTGHGDAEAWVEVADDGPGMTPEIQQRIFEPFFTTKPQGTGLGLAMAYAFVQRHRGRIEVDSACGRGTRLRLCFPIAAPVVEPAPAATAPVPPGRILIADDDAVARAALAALLEDDGFEVATAADGRAAVERLTTFAPEVLLVDLRMPGLDGVQVARRARATRPALPVVIMSGSDDSDTGIAELLREPATAHVPKPIDLPALMQALARVRRAG